MLETQTKVTLVIILFLTVLINIVIYRYGTNDMFVPFDIAIFIITIFFLAMSETVEDYEYSKHIKEILDKIQKH